jgi:hypothetical protein
MMSGVVSAVYGRRALDGAILDAIDEILAPASNPIKRTRKGRVWDCSIGGRPIHVSVEDTARVLGDCEGDLLKLGLLRDDASFRVIVASACHTAEDRAIVISLVQQICRTVNGVCVPEA